MKNRLLRCLIEQLPILGLQILHHVVSVDDDIETILAQTVFLQDGHHFRLTHPSIPVAVPIGIGNVGILLRTEDPDSLMGQVSCHRGSRSRIRHHHGTVFRHHRLHSLGHLTGIGKLHVHILYHIRIKPHTAKPHGNCQRRQQHQAKFISAKESSDLIGRLFSSCLCVCIWHTAFPFCGLLLILHPIQAHPQIPEKKQKPGQCPLTGRSIDACIDHHLRSDAAEKANSLSPKVPAQHRIDAKSQHGSRQPQCPGAANFHIHAHGIRQRLPQSMPEFPKGHPLHIHGGTLLDMGELHQQPEKAAERQQQRQQPSNQAFQTILVKTAHALHQKNKGHDPCHSHHDHMGLHQQSQENTIQPGMFPFFLFQCRQTDHKQKGQCIAAGNDRIHIGKKRCKKKQCPQPSGKRTSP